MLIRWIGAGFVIAASGGCGFMLAARHKKEERSLNQLLYLLDYMECELQYKLTPLPALCRGIAKEARGSLSTVFLKLAHELEDQIAPDADRCMQAALQCTPDIPIKTEDALTFLGKSLGRFDLQGQLKGIEAVRNSCHVSMKDLERNRLMHTRGYQTLGLCAGAALVILFI